MTDIEQKALALLGEVSPYKCEKVDHAHHAYLCAALRLSVERHEAFRQKVSDVVYRSLTSIAKGCAADAAGDLSRFIIPAPKRDPLEEVLQEIDHAAMWVDECAKEIRAALEARGLEIREKGK